MSGHRFSNFKSRLFKSCNSYLNRPRYADQSQVRLAYASVNNNYRKTESQSAVNFPNTQLRGLASVGDTQCYNFRRFSVVASSSISFGGRSVGSFVSFPSYRLYSSSSSGADSAKNVDVSAVSGRNEVGAGDSGGGGSEWVDKLKDAWQSAADAVTYAGQKAHEASEKLNPYILEHLDGHPYLKNVVVPIGCYLTGTMLAWVVLPRILRRFHKYSTQGTVALLAGSSSVIQVPYEKSFWGALEDPVRYMITFMAFVEMYVVLSLRLCCVFFSLLCYDVFVV